MGSADISYRGVTRYRRHTVTCRSRKQLSSCARNACRSIRVAGCLTAGNRNRNPPRAAAAHDVLVRGTDHAGSQGCLLMAFGASSQYCLAAIRPSRFWAVLRAMIEPVLVPSLLLLIPCSSRQACAQFTDAHNYDNTPAGINQIELNYSYVHANASIDSSLVIEGAKLNLYQ